MQVREKEVTSYNSAYGLAFADRGYLIVAHAYRDDQRERWCGTITMVGMIWRGIP